PRADLDRLREDERRGQGEGIQSAQRSRLRAELDPPRGQGPPVLRSPWPPRAELRHQAVSRARPGRRPVRDRRPEGRRHAGDEGQEVTRKPRRKTKGTKEGRRTPVRRSCLCETPVRSRGLLCFSRTFRLQAAFTATGIPPEGGNYSH